MAIFVPFRHTLKCLARIQIALRPPRWRYRVNFRRKQQAKISVQRFCLRHKGRNFTKLAKVFQVGLHQSSISQNNQIHLSIVSARQNNHRLSNALFFFWQATPIEFIDMVNEIPLLRTGSRFLEIAGTFHLRTSSVLGPLKQHPPFCLGWKLRDGVSELDYYFTN